MLKLSDYGSMEQPRGLLGPSTVLTSGTCMNDTYVNGSFMDLLLREVDRFVDHYVEDKEGEFILHSDGVWEMVNESSDTMTITKEVNISTKKIGDVIIQRKFCLEIVVMKSHYVEKFKIKLIEDNVFFMDGDVVLNRSTSFHTEKIVRTQVLASKDNKNYINGIVSFEL